MALKSYRLKPKKKKEPKLKSNSKDLITAGVTALLGVALLSETANAVRRI